MTKAFVDTWFFIGYTNRFDSDHRRAMQIDRRLGGVRLITHDAVLSEFLTFFAESGRYWRESAADMVRRVLLDHRFEVLPADRSLFLTAVNHYADRLDKEYSLVDCMSMLVMKDHGITHVLTNDHHFRQEGFTLVNE